MRFVHYNGSRRRRIELRADDLLRPRVLSGRFDGRRPTTWYLPTYCFWLSVGDAWRRWVEREGMDVRRWAHGHSVRVDEGRLLVVSTAAHVAEIEARFGRPQEATDMMLVMIDWAAVVRAHPRKAGILVLRSRLGDLVIERHPWVGMFDADSAAIWDARMAFGARSSQQPMLV